MNTKANILIGLGVVASVFGSQKGSKNACWRYNVLTDLETGGLDTNRRNKGKSYPEPRHPFGVVALRDVVPHDTPGFSQKFSKDFQKMMNNRDKLEDKRGEQIFAVMKEGEECSIYDMDFDPALRQIEGYGVFVHANRHMSSYRKPTKSYRNQKDESVLLTARQKKMVNLPSRGVHVGLRGSIMNPQNLPKGKADFVYYSPHVPYWRKLTKGDLKKMEKGEKIDLRKKPRLISADFALLANKKGSRLPYVLVWNGVYDTDV
jgi:hypothetical protein